MRSARTSALRSDDDDGARVKARGCFGAVTFFALLFVVFGVSSYFWFKFFVRGKSIPTPALSGKSIAQSRAVTSDLGLIMIVDNREDRNSEQVPTGAVVWQNRPAGRLIKRGTRIYVGQSLGPLVLSVPDLTGQSPRTALLRFSQRNLKLGELSYVDHPGHSGIIAEDPAKGTIVAGQTPISLLVAVPASSPVYIMPDLIDHRLDNSRPTLESRGLQVTNVKFEAYPGIADGIIIRQYPLPGSPVSSREGITLVVSRAEETFVQDPGVPLPGPAPTTPAPAPPVTEPAAPVPPVTGTRL